MGGLRAGAEAVGLSGMYGGKAGRPATEGLEDASCYPALIAELLGRGWTERELAALTWGNVSRALRETEFADQAERHRRG